METRTLPDTRENRHATNATCEGFQGSASLSSQAIDAWEVSKMKALLTTALCTMTVFGAGSADYVEVRPFAFETISAIASGPVELLHELDRKSLGIFCPLDSVNQEFGVVVSARSPFETSHFEVQLAMGIEKFSWPVKVEAYNYVFHEWFSVVTMQGPEESGVRIIQEYVINGDGFVNPKRGEVAIRFLWMNSVEQPVWLDYVRFRFVK
jgi:hypothetical protein